MATRKCQSVLYVDDDPDVCAVVRATLCLIAGMEVQTANSGEMAVDLAYEMRPDLIVLDVMMPGLDGPATYQRIRECPLIADTPVIFVTAKVLPSEVAQFLRLGAIGVVAKPFDPLTIGDELTAIWNKASGTFEGPNRREGQAVVLAQVDPLVEQFLERTRGDVARLRSLARGIQPDGRIDLKEIERIAHSIHGAGAMFGFPDVSASGGAIEHLAESLLTCREPEEGPAVPAAERLDELTERLSRALEAARVTAPSKTAMFQARPGNG
jgi:two-component system OmpR family response regulator